MELDRFIDALSNPYCFPDAPPRVEVRQTHISVVFLTEQFAYKIKKPVEMGFLDFHTLELRHHFCQEEVRLNRRLAPSVYLGVVPIALEEGQLVVEGNGTPIEWAVKMRRLPDDATLENRLKHGQLDARNLENLARKLAEFHAAANRSERISRCGRFEIVAGNARENFDQSLPEVGHTVEGGVFERVRTLTELKLDHLRSTINSRAQRGIPCDTHGDLHLDHVYLLPGGAATDNLIIIDCIEFNERFRFSDPVADMAFLTMDLKFHGRSDLARAFADAYFTAAADPEGKQLLPFYISYRAVVRAKVEGFKLREAEIPAVEKDLAIVRSKAHWLLALGELEEPGRRPCLLLIGGLPGSGKSTLARALAGPGNFTVVRSDVIRKELAGLSPETRASADFRAGLYSSEWTERTYDECLRRAGDMLFQGRRVIVDATFRDDAHRRRFIDAASQLGVPAVWLECRASRAIIRARLEARHGDASDADWRIYESAASHWDPPGPGTAERFRPIDTDGSVEQATDAAIGLLHSVELF